MFAFLCFGDSITHGRGENPSLGWVGRFKSEFEAKDYYNAVYNLGIPGDTSKNLLDRIDVECRNRIRVLRDTDKFYVTIAIGINDSRELGTPDNNETKIYEFASNVHKIIDIAKKYTQNVIVISITPVDETKVYPFEGTYFSNKVIQKYNVALEKVAGEAKCRFIDIYGDLIRLNYSELLQDGLHPNEKGYDVMYSILKDKLLD